jgi:hypothetical protein
MEFSCYATYSTARFSSAAACGAVKCKTGQQCAARNLETLQEHELSWKCLEADSNTATATAKKERLKRDWIGLDRISIRAATSLKLLDGADKAWENDDA